MQADHSQTAAAAVKVLPRMETPKSAGVALANKKQPDQIRYPFWFGGSASSIASCVTHPLDLSMSFLLPCREAFSDSKC